jgi:eukaryotic-like serine/threonine-protein kinase
VEQSQNGKFLDAIPFYQRALALDQNFGYAYGTLAVNYNNTRQPGLAAENATRAYELRERMSELERLRIESFYYAFVTGEIERGIETLELYRRIYPRDERGPLNLSDRYGTIGQFERAVVQAREALRLNPNNAVGYWNLADSLMRLNRFAEAREICEKGIEQNPDTSALHYFLYQIAFADHGAAAMQQQLDWATGKPDEYISFDWQNAAAAGRGQWRLAQDFSHRSIALAPQSAAREVAAREPSEAAVPRRPSCKHSGWNATRSHWRARPSPWRCAVRPRRRRHSPTNSASATRRIP